MFDQEFVKSTLTPVLAIAGFILGLVGSVLGVWNLWLTRKSHNLKVRVDVFGGGENMIEMVDGTQQTFPQSRAINIRFNNDSYFPITVTETGLVLKGSLWMRRRYHRLEQNWREDNQIQRIESRDVYTYSFGVGWNGVREKSYFFQVLTDSRFSLDTAIAAYAVLATGQRVCGGRKKVRPIIKDMQAAVESLLERTARQKKT